jgi:membrane-associated phospholipid phosphatase
MPAALALARAIDQYAVSMAASVTGRSNGVDSVVSFLARHLAKVHIALLIVLLAGGRGPSGRRRRETALRMVVALPLTIGAVSVVGKLVERDRPFAQQPGGTVLVDHARGRSFPSRHSACAAAMTTIAFPTAPLAGAIMGLGALGLAVSRVYTRLHYPSDILGGWIIGVGIGIIARRKELPRVL